MAKGRRRLESLFVARRAHLGQDRFEDLEQLLLLDRVVGGSNVDLDKVELGTAAERGSATETTYVGTDDYTQLPVGVNSQVLLEGLEAGVDLLWARDVRAYELRLTFLRTDGAMDQRSYPSDSTINAPARRSKRRMCSAAPC
jgi:hypothetical protein